MSALLASSAIKSRNLQAVLLALLRHDQISRVRLSRLTGLSTTTITKLVGSLLEQGLVAEDDRDAPANGRRGVGRPQTALRLLPESRWVIGVHLDIDQARLALADLRARPVYTRRLALKPGASAEASLAAIAAAARALAAESGIDPARIIGLGAGVSGLVDPASGVNRFAPNLGWHDVPTAALLRQHTGLPVVVDNNVRAMALGEVMFGPARDVKTLAFVYARIGVGAGFTVGGQIYRGSGAGAGEIGHMTMIVDGGEVCRCGNTGCLETIFSEPALVRLAYQQAEREPGGLLARLLAEPGSRPIEQVFAAARQGDAAALALLHDRARYVGAALANVVNIFNPERIVLGGLFVQGADLLLPPIEQTVRARAFAHLGERVVVQTASFGGQAGMVGAAALALDAFFYRHELSAPI